MAAPTSAASPLISSSAGQGALSARVVAPTHPGFGDTPARRNLTTIDDLAYLYLGLLDAMDLRPVVLVGVSLGGWIAAEMAIKSTRDAREIADIYALADFVR